MKLTYNVMCIDDYGTQVVRCQYSNAPVHIDTAIVLGSTMPGVDAKYLCHPMLGPPAYKRSRRAFEESDVNCNTCVNFARRPHEKSAGMVKGMCLHVPAPTTNDMIYRREGHTFWVHPNDCMAMTCHQQRT